MERATTRRVLLLMPTTTYKADDFLEAARRLEIRVVVGSDRRQALEDAAPGHTMTLDFVRPEASVRTIAAAHATRPFRAIVGTDEETVELAALAAASLGLPHNPPSAVRASQDKLLMRRAFETAGLRTPWFRPLALDRGPLPAAAELDYPCVLKPRALSASRGVLRADDARTFVAAFETVASIIAAAEDEGRRGESTTLLVVEGYLPGVEIALEGLLADGELRVLALFDKPDPLVGPTFEETLYVTPSRLSADVCDAVGREVSAGCRALGLQEGPVHAELRVHAGRPWLLEISPRTIGGLCSHALRFGAGVSLEELVLRHALGIETQSLRRDSHAAGAMMIPIPRAGVLHGVDGQTAARAVPGIEELTISIPTGAEVLPLPQGHRYLGFLIAHADTPRSVEHALRTAHAHLTLHIS
jgi:biotin carboxylase